MVDDSIGVKLNHISSMIATINTNFAVINANLINHFANDLDAAKRFENALTSMQRNDIGPLKELFEKQKTYNNRIIGGSIVGLFIFELFREFILTKLSLK